MRPLILAALIVAPMGAFAAPRVAADLAPAAALVEMVMEGTGGQVDLLTPANAEGHNFSLTPSTARAAARADLVVATGAGIAPRIDRALASLTDAAKVLDLSQASGVALLERREEAVFDDHDHHGHAHHDDEGADPHWWLDPRNGAAALSAIAARLTELDPVNAPTYALNAAAGTVKLTALEAEIALALSPYQDRAWVAAHDAYLYFETRFALSAVAALADADHAHAGAARLSEVRKAMADSGAKCVLDEGPAPDKGAEAAAKDAGMRLVIADPQGRGLDAGPDRYARTIRAVADALIDCLR